MVVYLGANFQLDSAFFTKFFGAKALLVGVDMYSGLTYLEPQRVVNARTTTAAFTRILKRTGYPIANLLTDRYSVSHRERC